MGERLPNRQNLRLKGFDYTVPGYYFVTVCARDRREVFGAVINGRAVLNACGQVADACWREIPKHFPSVRIDEHVVMPNHMHGVMNAGEPEYLGDKALLDRPKLGFLASRGEAMPHGTLPLRSGEAILSGFLSPMERRVFWAGLAHKRPLIWVKPWTLREGAESPAIREALDQSRLLILSPFDSALTATSARRAVWCNEYVLAHCDRLAVGHLNPDGMLACILTEAEPDMKVVYL